ncbi:kinase-like domain-containing protein [Thelonectria olida]|uniref:non-specific serine/threonine protein kinase n=1 Tax=Thelonectria olida TaxID=1576542 RepID=A0A9P8VV82_9HYPO|nr:kinase-like domain-containing protein [Thelonectria olida]
MEEGSVAYRPGGFHPVYIGGVLNDRYKVLNKIGYGVYSTAWLCRGGIKTAFRALKVLSGECYGQHKDTFEEEILTHLRDGDHNEMGYAYICHLVDDFVHKGPNGVHVFLVFELMGETLRRFGAWFFESELPNPAMRRFTIQLMLALDFAHRHDIVHTDLKPDNIIIEFGYLAEVPIPQQNRDEELCTVIPFIPLRRFYFTEADGQRVAEFDIALGYWGEIQPVTLRSPEVLIEAPWDETADCGRVAPDGHYELREHLAEIVDLFGPFPKELLEQGNKDPVGKMFDGEGQVKDSPPFNRPPLSDEFGSFLKTLMKINPSERLSTMDLLRHPWLDAVYDTSASNPEQAPEPEA